MNEVDQADIADIGENIIPDAEESRNFLGEIWSIGKEHNRQVEWFHELNREHNNVNMEEL